MWKYKGDELGLEGIVGVPNRDMTDEEFAEANAKLAMQFGEVGVLKGCGLWEHIDDKPTRVAPTTIRPSTPITSTPDKGDE